MRTRLDAIGRVRKASTVMLRDLCLAALVAFQMLTVAPPAEAKEHREGGAAQDLPEPKAWLPSRGRECRNRGRYRRFCAGPRRVAAPSGKAGRRGKQLGLGTRKTASELLLRAPEARWVEAAQAVEAGQGLVWPVPGGKLWRGFGRVRRGPKRRQGHKGVDLGAAEGSPIVAAQSGIVAYANNELRGYGNVLMIVHGDGTMALYAHCQAILVFPGQRVKQGQPVAQVGHTGIARGTHLHFEYRKRGRPKDPARLFVDAPPDGKTVAKNRRAKKRRKQAQRRSKRAREQRRRHR